MALIRLMSTDKLHLQDEAWAIYENDVFHVIIEDLPYQDGNDNGSPLARIRFFNNSGLHDLPKTNIFLLKEDAANIDYPARIAYETKMRRHLSGEDL